MNYYIIDFIALFLDTMSCILASVLIFSHWKESGRSKVLMAMLIMLLGLTIEAALSSYTLLLFLPYASFFKGIFLMVRALGRTVKAVTMWRFVLYIVGIGSINGHFPKDK